MTDPNLRGEAIRHTMSGSENGRPVTVQCYLDQIDRSGETSFIYLNGLTSYQIEKDPTLRPSFHPTEKFHEEMVRPGVTNSQGWHRGEQIRKIVHRRIVDTCGCDELLLYNRVDIAHGGPKDAHEFYVLEVLLIDGSLYPPQNPIHLKKFVDAIAIRMYWRRRHVSAPPL